MKILLFLIGFILMSVAAFAAPQPTIQITHACHDNPASVAYFYEGEDYSIEWHIGDDDPFLTYGGGFMGEATLGEYEIYLLLESRGVQLRYGPYYYSVYDITPTFSTSLSNQRNGICGDAGIEVNLSSFHSGITYTAYLKDQSGQTTLQTATMTSASHTFTGLDKGHYLVVVEANPGKCVYGQSVIVDDEDFTASMTTSPQTCHLQGGSITVDINGFQSGESFSVEVENVDNNQVINYQQTTASYTLQNLAPGSYSVLLSNACENYGELVVVEGHGVEATAELYVDGSCQWKFTASMLGGATAMSYNWIVEDENGNLLTPINNNPPEVAIYAIPTLPSTISGRVEATTADGCVYTYNLDIPSTDMFLGANKTPTYTVTNDQCVFDVGKIAVDWSSLNPNPSVPVHVVKLYKGGVYQTYLNPNGATSVTFTGLDAHSDYDVVLESWGACHTDNGTEVNDIVILDDGMVIETTSEPFCDLGSVSKITATYLPGATYSWVGGTTSPGASDNEILVSPPLVPFYSLTVMHPGCNSVTKKTPAEIFTYFGTKNIEPVRCSVTPGTISLTPNTNSTLAPYTMTVNGQTTGQFGINQTSPEVEIPTAGTYPVTVTSVNTGCESTFNVLVEDEQMDWGWFWAVDPTDCNASNGEISASVFYGGTEPYSYTWNNGATSQYMGNLTPGTYSVTVTDVNGCTVSATHNLSNSYGMYAYISGWDGPACSPDKGRIESFFFDPQPLGPITYQWDTNTGSQTTRIASGLSDGSYSVTATDGNGCTYTTTGQTNQGWFYPTPEVEQFLDCANNQIGFRFINYDDFADCPSVTVDVLENGSNITPGGPGGIVINQGQNNIFWVPTTNALNPSYSYELRFTSCCNSSAWVATNTLSFALPSPTIDVTPASCNTPGNVSITFVGGSFGPFQCVWEDGVISNQRNDLLAGSYQVSMQNQQGCTIVETVTVPGPSGAPQLINPNSCDEKISLAATNISGGLPPYSLTVDGNPTSLGTILSTVGTYNLQIEDANGCIGNETLEVYDEIYTAVPQITAPSCALDDGEVYLQVTNNVSSIVSYIWEDQSSNVYNGHTLVGLAAGNYDYTVTDTRGCPLDSSVTVPANSNMTINLTSNCPPAINSLLGGSAPYRVEFIADLTLNPNATQQTYTKTLDANTTYPYYLNDLDEGAYDVYVIDNNGCEIGPFAFNNMQTQAVRDFSALGIDVKMRWVRTTADIEPAQTYVEADVIKDDLARQANKFLDDLDDLDGHADFCDNQSTDNLSANFDQSLHHYTLYYYNVKDELVRTVPPAGVDFITNNGGTDLNDLLAFREGTSPTIPNKIRPNHKMVTQYNYNGLGQMVDSKTPDKGKVVMIYSEDGLLRYSQDENQAASTAHTYSYTLYDELKRVIEVGELTCPTALTSQNIGSIPLDGLPTATQKDEWTKTYYTTPHIDNSTPIAYYNQQGEEQSYLRNRVSYTESGVDISGVPQVQTSTTYSYDIHGNVQWIRQNIPGLGEHYIAYEYDLLTSVVKKVRFNEFSDDKFFHKYEYDEQKRLTETYTSRDGIIWDRDAAYNYYAHGPLKRTELGDDRVQGLDYVYTIHGWIKSVNNPLMDQYNLDAGPTNDPGEDGFGNPVMKDAFGYTLGYYEGDFTRTGASISSVINWDEATPLYNGNISAWSNGVNENALTNSLTINSPLSSESISQRNFVYDELSRIKSSKLGETQTNVGAMGFPVLDFAGGMYATDYEYDGNGNIQFLERYGDNGTNSIDAFSYSYGTGDFQNRLLSVTDGASVSPAGALDGTQSYTYDYIGNLTHSINGNETLSVDWRVDGKVEAVTITDGSTISQLNFIYDASGNRVAKIFDPNTSTSNDEEYTYHVRDASGNIMATYTKRYNVSVWERKLKERTLFGSARLGVDNKIHNLGTTDIVRSSGVTNYTTDYRELSNKLFELSDHLGNVTMTISDAKQQVGAGLYEAQLVSYKQYYPFGWAMPERQANPDDYRFGFNGKEKCSGVVETRFWSQNL